MMEQISLYNERPDGKWQLADDIQADVSVQESFPILTLDLQDMVDYLSVVSGYNALVTSRSMILYDEKWWVVQVLFADPRNGFVRLSAKYTETAPDIYADGVDLTDANGKFLLDSYGNELAASPS